MVSSFPFLSCANIERKPMVLPRYACCGSTSCAWSWEWGSILSPKTPRGGPQPTLLQTPQVCPISPM